MNAQSVKIFTCEPFFSGSHKSFAEGWNRYTRHGMEILGLPGRVWKWRMRSAAFEFARIAVERDLNPDLWVCGSLMDVAHFKALLGRECAPVALFFHEAQASYPSKDGNLAERDYQFLMTDLASAGAADEVWFNTAYLRDAFLTETRAFLERMPDSRPLWLLEGIESKARVLHLGVELEAFSAERGERVPPYRILWPHRWEHDKNPEEFFGVLERLAGAGLDFRLLVAGGRYSRVPAVFDRAKAILSDRIEHWGEVKDRGEYARLLARADIVVSTALHETFGLAMVEAAYAGAHPVAPARLSYPEVIPGELHGACLYEGEGGLEKRLGKLLAGEEELIPPARLREVFSRYDWKNRVAAFDDAATRISQIAK